MMVKQTIVAGMAALALAWGFQVLPAAQGEIDEWPPKTLSVEVNDEIFNPAPPQEAVAEVNDEKYHPRLADSGDSRDDNTSWTVNENKALAEVNDEKYHPHLAEVNDDAGRA